VRGQSSPPSARNLAEARNREKHQPILSIIGWRRFRLKAGRRTLSGKGFGLYPHPTMVNRSGNHYEIRPGKIETLKNYSKRR